MNDSRLEEMMQRIQKLERENVWLREELEKLSQSRPQGRKLHDDKWMESYRQWKELYEQGFSTKEIADRTGMSQRTCYRYKAYCESDTFKTENKK